MTIDEIKGKFKIGDRVRVMSAKNEMLKLKEDNQISLFDLGGAANGN